MIFVKFPEPGRVKTRLARSVGDQEAAAIYRNLVARLAKQVWPGGAGADRWDLWIVFDPSEREAELREWLDPLFGVSVAAYVPQAAGDLGGRLAAAFSAGFAVGFVKVAAIGSDCVELDEASLRACWRLLDSSDVVFGPAHDGGYYLIGMKRMHPSLFTGIPWSTEQTLAESRSAAQRAGLSHAALATLNDIDEIEQWQAVNRADARKDGGARAAPPFFWGPRLAPGGSAVNQGSTKRNCRSGSRP